MKADVKNWVVVIVLLCLVFIFTCSKKSTKSGGTLGPFMEVYPTYFSFGPMSSPIETTFTISNTGGGVLSGVVGVETAYQCECVLLVPGDTTHYEVLSYDDIPAGQGVNARVRFFPKFGWWSEANCYLLSVSNISTNFHTYQEIQLKGYRPRPEAVCSLSTYVLDFGIVNVGKYLQKTFTITNVGPDSSMLKGYIDKNDNIGCTDFAIIGGSGGNFSLGAGESHTVTVLFTPSTSIHWSCTINTNEISCGSVTCIGN